MMIKIIIASVIFLAACGKEVKISSTKLESLSQVTSAEKQKDEQTGTLSITDSGAVIKMPSKTYTVSKFSSYSTLSYIQKLPVGTNQKVLWIGQISGTTVAIQAIGPASE